MRQNPYVRSVGGQGQQRPWSTRPHRHAAARFFRTLLKGQGRPPRRLVTDKLRRDAAAHRVLNLFRIGRHLLRAVHHRLMRSQAVGVWRDATCA